MKGDCSLVHLTTYFSLPPGIPANAVIREFLQRVFETYRWFTPVRYGLGSLGERLEEGPIDYEALGAYYDEVKTITIAAKTDRDFLLIYPAKWEYPYVGRITWATSATEAKKPSWRAAHLRQVHEFMTMMDSPLAWAGLDSDLDRKQQRLEPDPDGLSVIETYTVRDYSEGLAGLFWRNFFGPPFVRMFGERLNTLPHECRQELGEGIVLVEPYELPSMAGTPQAVERERQFIAQLGAECFYDHKRQFKPTRRPELAPAR